MNIVDRIVNFGNGEFLSRLIEYVIFKPETKEKLKVAVNLWCESPEEAEKKYGHISIWNVSLITDMSFLFDRKDIDNDISKWDVSNVTDMSYMFYGTYFNGNLEDWDVSSVTNMSGMFKRSTFNHSIQSWDVSNVKYMSSMFEDNAIFNQPLNLWNVSSVKNMNSMFCGAEDFNYPLDKWNVSHVIHMVNMFAFTNEFNQDLNDWDVSSIISINGMFRNSNFNRPLNWDLSKIEDTFSIFMNCHNFNFKENINFDNWDDFSITIFEHIVGCHEDNYLEYDFEDEDPNEMTGEYIFEMNHHDMEKFNKIRSFLEEKKK